MAGASGTPFSRMPPAGGGGVVPRIPPSGGDQAVPFADQIARQPPGMNPPTDRFPDSGRTFEGHANNAPSSGEGIFHPKHNPTPAPDMQGAVASFKASRPRIKVTKPPMPLD